MFGGVAYSYGSQIGRGSIMILGGEYQRGIENILPAAFRNPAKVVRCAIENACSAASLLLTADCAMVEETE